MRQCPTNVIHMCQEFLSQDFLGHNITLVILAFQTKGRYDASSNRFLNAVERESNMFLGQTRVEVSSVLNNAQIIPKETCWSVAVLLIVSSLVKEKWSSHHCSI